MGCDARNCGRIPEDQRSLTGEFSRHPKGCRHPSFSLSIKLLDKSHKLLIINSSMNGVQDMGFTPSFFFAHHSFSAT